MRKFTAIVLLVAAIAAMLALTACDLGGTKTSPSASPSASASVKPSASPTVKPSASPSTSPSGSTSPSPSAAA
ncbi:hypothetical protein LJC34_07430 [Oscillospiraceae bacterium OttesenSCG-928-G22]|nr:hypothetical protein [Oscillospiraceae bacterium OttesenSCG-928-G22]